jgi:DNA-directed RNA polymerase II subunit RPB2
MDKENISWKIIDKYFTDNPNCLVSHHLESFNDFFKTGLKRIFRENNPIRFIEREDESESDKRNECLLYLGGKDGNNIYYGKPVIYDDNHTHYMFPNDARLRNMTYGITIHYDVDVDFIYYIGDEKKTNSLKINKVYLGRFPIMLQSDLCILNTMSREVRFNAGECRNDYGGYFIIDGKEKVVVPQEKFADNMLYIRSYGEDDIYSYSAEIRSVSEDSSKPIRTTSVKIVAPSTSYSNNQIVVGLPNVKKPVPLFILMRALGIISDKDIIKTCLLDLDKNASIVDLFIPSVHDANKVFTQQIALEFIAELTKRGTVSGVIEILSDYFLPHIGELNFLEKAYFVGYMVYRLLKVYTKEEKPTDRDNFRFKRIELSGTLIYDLFREYYLIQKKDIARKIDEEYYYHKSSYTTDESMSRKEKQSLKKKVQMKESIKENKYKDNFISLIESNIKSFFKDRIVEQGFKKAFKGNWGSQAHTKRLGAVQDLNRLSWYTFISHLRKINLPLDSSAKVVGPRLLNSSQWGFIDPIDTPDGGNIGLHKHLSISTYITSGSSGYPIIKWIRSNTPLKLILECGPEQIANSSKVFVNGSWIGITDKPFELVNLLKLYRRNGILPIYTSLSFDIEHNEVQIYTDSGRLTRPIYYIDDNKLSYERGDLLKLLDKGTITWEEIISGFMKKNDEKFNTKNNKIYDLLELYPDIGNSTEEVLQKLIKNKSMVDYVDTAEEEAALIAITPDDLKKNRFYTHMEIDPSLILGVMSNLIIYPENNPLPRNSFSCGQSKQAVSVYHSNYQMRIDKMGVILNYGQIPLIKSRYLDYINREEQPYGVNAIVAIMSYTGYNVEDAILINEGSILRGLFRTSYYSMYEAREESSKVTGMNNSKFANIEKNNVIGKKKGYDYSFLDEHGLIKENTELNDKMILIGKINSNLENKELWIDDSVKPKKGQLGYVDKSFITLGEEGFNIAKVRLREERIPAIGDKMACALPTQQVLTNEGWVEIQHIDITKHKVATLDINGNMCYEFPTNKFVYEHNGKMYTIKNKQVEVVCTLNHKLYVKRREHNGIKKDYELIEAQNVIGKMVRFQKSMNNIYPDIEWMELGDKKYKMDDWLQLLGMFIADGSTNSANSGAIYISALKPRKISFNTNIMMKLGLKYKYDNINNKFILLKGQYPEIYREFDTLSVRALNKYLPHYVWNLSKRQCIILLDALMEGDGHTYSDGFSRYGTISLRLANDICRLAVHCGWSGITKIAAEPGDSPHMIKNSGKNKDKFHLIESKNTYYKISIIRKQNQPYINKKINDSNKEELVDYEGKVYCIEMQSSHLYYMRENNFAPSMLIGNSRAGQKGTIGLIIPEADMPFLEDGTHPDLIINPHALPSRMTIGQIVESMFGIACVSYGGFGDCTAFQVKGSNYNTYGPMLTKAGFNHTGNHVLYNGMTGEQIQANIYMGPTYYMRLKHMVKDKINYRARGPNQQLTRQPVQGRANDGGLRIGEMERDGVCAHGLAHFLNESFLVRGDEYYMAVCNKTGSIAIYNEAKNLFLSPYSDGPINFHTNPDGTMNIKNLTKFGRSFSLIRIPYSFKLLIQELQTMNIQMRIITDENVDQLLSMSYSNNINKLLKDTKTTSIKNTELLIKKYVNEMSRLPVKANEGYNIEEQPIIPLPLNEEDIVKQTDNSKVYPSETSVQTPGDQTSPPYAPTSPPYSANPNSPGYAPTSPPYSANPNSPPYAPGTPESKTESILDVPKETEENKEDDKSDELPLDTTDKKIIETSPETSGIKKITI